LKGKSRGSSFTRHWVRIRIDGFRPERLISQAADKSIAMRSITYRDETEVYLILPQTDYKKLKKLAGSKYRLTIMEEGGVMAGVSRLRANKLAVIGAVLAVLFYFAQISFVREVNVLGCETIPEDQIRTLLREEGLYEGGLKNFDCDKIEERLFQEYESVVWAKVSYQGRYVQVEISEGDVQEKAIPDRSKPCNLVAEQDCYVEKVYTYKGRAHVAEGDFVKKGEILISGTVPIEHPSYAIEQANGENTADGAASMVHYVHAEGKIMARVPCYFSFTMEPDSSEAQIQTAVRTWAKENVPENAEILNKDFHFDAKKNIIKVYGIIETRQPVGVEKEITIDKRQESGNEETAD